MTRRDADGMIEHERKILSAIRSFYKEHGYCPSYREIGEHIGNNSLSHIRRGLDTLERLNFIRRDQGRSRTIQLVDEFERFADVLLRLPLVGRIQAGEPIHIPGGELMAFDYETVVEVPLSLLPRNTHGLFALQVQGDSMIDAMIANGDVVICRAIDQPHNGQMVAVWLKEESETTLKKYYLENDRVRLQPANPAYQALYYPPENVVISGEVVFVYRAYQG